MFEKYVEKDNKDVEEVVKNNKSKKVKKFNKRTEIINKLVEAVKKGDNAMINKYRNQLNNLN